MKLTSPYRVDSRPQGRLKGRLKWSQLRRETKERIQEESVTYSARAERVVSENKGERERGERREERGERREERGERREERGERREERG